MTRGVLACAKYSCLSPGWRLVIWPCKDVSINQDQRWSIASTNAPIYNWASGLQILPSGGQGSQIWLWDSRVPYDWKAANSQDR